MTARLGLNEAQGVQRWDAAKGYYVGDVQIKELFLGDLYQHAFYDTTPVKIDGFLSSGTPVRRYVERFATLNLPQITVRFVASYGGQPVSAFDLFLPQYRAVKAF